TSWPKALSLPPSSKVNESSKESAHSPVSQIRRWLSQEPSVVTSAATGAKAYRKTLSTPRTRHCRLSVRSTSGSANFNTYSNRAPETTPVPSLFLRKTPRYSGALRAREWAGQPGLGSAGHQWCSAQEYPCVRTALYA